MTDKEKKEKKNKKKSLEETCDEYLQGWKRALADYENLQKNLASTKEAERNRIKENVAHDLIPVIDNFEQAIHHLPDLTDEEQKKLENWMMGVKFIQKQFEDVMAGLGIVPIDTLDAFDPAIHDAASEERDETKEDGAVLRVIQSGWKMGEKVIRPAKVVVNKKEN